MPYYTIDPSARPLARAIQAAVSMAGIDASEVRAVFPHASGYPIDDVTDNYAMHEVFGARTRAVPVAVPKASFGNLLGAAAPLDVTLALTSSRTGRLPGHPGFTRLAPGIELDVVGPTREVDAWEHSIVTSRGYGGINASVVVRS
jgi:3-oxoacyl-(acyl-carrier-protein) synthase